MRTLAIALAVLILALQWPLWIGKGSWLRVWDLDRQLAEQKLRNDKLKERNTALEADVVDLKTGTDAIEERARNELGMVRQDEVFFQILDNRKPASSNPASAAVGIGIASDVAAAPASGAASAP
ncbi:cell division protein FtsB [Amantichitinum ursilacus]|uniref:Cell division protein FtsB n=1 Tax=Amantichitinum ursilacus TaxID=857265 RepID=A0A0N0GM01_9NEIS|nr:cell division protein FtsB [Amantichitinum ursilacus]KPC50548.1 Cell division protein FtsB [Amantichitinum ursilacus]